MSQQDLEQTDTTQPSAAWERDWWGEFHLHAFLSLTLADTKVERRELVWIKRFFQQHGRFEYYGRLKALVETRSDTTATLNELIPFAKHIMSSSEKRRLVYNLAQMCKSKGGITDGEYENILDIAERLGLLDTDADSIINSVFSINDTLAAIVGLLALGTALYVTRVVIVPLIIAIFVSMLVNRIEQPIAAWLRVDRARPLTRLAAMFSVVGILFALIMAAVYSGQEIAERLPFYQVRLTSVLQETEQTLASFGVPIPDSTSLSRQLRKIPLSDIASGLLTSLFNVVANFVLISVFTGFLVLSKQQYEGILQEMNEKITAYISVKAFLSLATGLVVYLLCATFGLDFALFWATLAFLLNFIPSLGSIIATIPPIVLAIIQFDSPGEAVVFGGLLVAAQMLIGQVIEPKIMGDRLAVNPVAILLGLIFWGFLWGIPGMFLATPLMALLRILSSYFNFSRDFERMLAA